MVLKKLILGIKETNSSKMITINDFVDNEIIIQKGKKSFKKVVLI